MKQFQPGTTVTIPGLYLLVGEPPLETVLVNGQTEAGFLTRHDNSKAQQRRQRFKMGDVLPDLGYTNQYWVLMPNQ
jgi:hypothetical protein